MERVAGDFNAASHLDYSGPDTALVQWPCSSECARRGLIDSFSAGRDSGVSDLPIQKTWSPKPEQEAHNVHDRIDFVYYTGNRLKLIQSTIVDGTNSSVADWPSDHRAVVSKFALDSN